LLQEHLDAVIGLFIWAQIDDQRQRSFVTGYPGPPGFQDHEDIPGRMHAGRPVSEWPPAGGQNVASVAAITEHFVIDSVCPAGAEVARNLPNRS